MFSLPEIGTNSSKQDFPPTCLKMKLVTTIHRFAVNPSSGHCRLLLLEIRYYNIYFCTFNICHASNNLNLKLQYIVYMIL